MITDSDLQRWFRHRPPLGDQADRYVKIRAAALELAITIRNLTPPSPDQTTAIRKIREAVMTANAAIACEEYV